ncbi:MAG: hypothetical protein JXP37_05405 [Coriobacteriia bacterium]|nr:hypothetical protein [Coriobacteriia bacterium]
MRPSTPSVIVEGLAGRMLRGAVMLDNGMLGLLFEDDRILAVSDTAYLMHDEASANVIASVRKRLTEAAAELETLSVGVVAPHAESDVLTEATRMRDEQSLRGMRNGENRSKVTRTLDDCAELPFLAGDLLADQGHTLHTEVEKRARTEALKREIPEVSR